MGRYILALDQGTTSSRAVLFDIEGQIVAIEQEEFTQRYPQPGWVEHAPEDIWSTQYRVAERMLRSHSVSAEDIAGIGIANQRETTILWDRSTGRPVANAIVWQDRRTESICERLKSAGHLDDVRQRTGLTLDPYFSATKIQWLLDNTPGLRARAERGQIAFGTVDSYLLWQLTGGTVHATDASNASRTLLYNLTKGDWDDEMLAVFRVPREILPTIVPSSGYIGSTAPHLFGISIPIAGVAGDQQAATFGQACHTPGSLKNTYGTGCFLLMNVGERQVYSENGLIRTVAWQLGPKTNSEPPRLTYALEGSVFVAGAAVQWLRDELQIIRNASEIEAIAASVPDSSGVYFVPAFVGLGAPYWDSRARGAILGLTRGAGRAHIARAALEAVCFQSADLLDAMRADSGLEIQELRVDGGMVVNNTLLQMQADLFGATVLRPKVTETTALGAACLAGLGVGIWRNLPEIAATWEADAVFEPAISEDERESRMAGWRAAVATVRHQP